MEGCTMKCKYLFALIPVIALSACSNSGQEITAEEAAAIVSSIKEKQDATDSYCFSYSATTRIGDRKSVTHYKYAAFEYGGYMCSREESETSKTDNYKSSKIIYHWRETRSDTYFYVKTFNGADNTTTIRSYVVPDIQEPSEQYKEEAAKQEAFIEECSGLFDKVIYSVKDYGSDYKVENHCYSKGEGNLTAKVTYTFTGEKKNTTIKKIEFTYTFNDFLFESFKGTYVTFGGSKKVEEAKCAYNIKVSAPSNWEDYLIR